MSYICRFHPKANEEYAEAYPWYEDKVKGLGKRFYTGGKKKNCSDSKSSPNIRQQRA
ncbi:MAG TPA: hypothetical protein PL045_00755 [Chitinophagaceae bacterium]|nr:hypothetical protein [Chitinophagaceae bacterium]